MTHTENYELPLIEGTDVIDYEPFNEGMGKIDEALNTMDDKVQEAVDDVAQMGDTLTQKMEEVDQALQDTVDDVNASLEQTTQDLNDEVDSKLNRISKFVLARQYTIPEETYLFGSQSGTLVFPLTSVTPSISRIADVNAPNSDRFYVPYASSSGTPVSKIDFDLEVEPTGGDGTYNGACNTELELVKHHSGLPSETIASIKINSSVRTPIHLSALVTASTGTTFSFLLKSGYTHQLVGNASLTVENIGINN